MTRLGTFLLAAVAAMFAAYPAYACSSVVISGKVTPDGRPLLWKHRDSDYLQNSVKFFKGEKYSFIAIVNSVEDDPSVQTSTAADALQNAPGVEVDMEGNVSIRGAGSVDIWIDDKPSKMSGENLKMFLKTLPASAINRIEVITNPSSRYATASDAVINIVTNNKIKKNNFFGFGLNASSQPNAMPWLSYVWANDKMSFSVYAAGSLSNRRSKETYSKVSLKDTEDNSKDTVFREDSKSSRENKFYSGNLFMNFDYNIDESNTFSVWSMISGMSPVTNSEKTLDRYDFDPYAFNRYESKFEYKDVYIRGNINMDYRHRFKKKGNIIFSLGMNRNNSYNNETDIRRYLNDNPTYENINRQSEEHGKRITGPFQIPFFRARRI